MIAKTPTDEINRLKALRRYDILDTMAEQAYDDITLLASHVAGTPIALISLIDEERQWFKSKVGLEVHETPRDYAFCAHAILAPGVPFVVRDATADSRFADNPLVKGAPDIRYYFGAPLVTPDQHALGTLCVIDRKPRRLGQAQAAALEALSRQVVTHLELRRSASELRQAAHERAVYLGQLEDYQTKLEEQNARLLIVNKTDALTGIGNRRAFDQRLTDETYRAQRYASPLSLLMIDVDKFKDFNDAFGHPAGDLALKAVAKARRGVVRPSDFMARVGGEEFGLILPATDAAGAGALAERLRQAIAAAPIEQRNVTVSIGVSTLSTGVQGGQAMVEAADEALYEAKRTGRNRVVHAAR